MPGGRAHKLTNPRLHPVWRKLIRHQLIGHGMGKKAMAEDAVVVADPVEEVGSVAGCRSGSTVWVRVQKPAWHDLLLT